MIYIFYFFAIILVFLGYKSLRGGIDYLNYFKRELAKPKSNFSPFTSVFVPCRGIDQDLESNLSALFKQEYPSYEIVFTVDDEKDKSVLIIEDLIKKEQSVSAKLIIAGEAKNEGQKVHNLRQAVLEISEDSEVFVFVDSDARPNKNWLKNLTAPLQDENVGCATGYRWFIPQNNKFAAQIRSAWNASIASALGENLRKNFCWGGSMAIRRETFEKLEMHEKWRGTLSDDFALTRALQTEDLPIYFVPACLTATVEDCTFIEFLEFSTRQMKITRVYSPNLWKASLIGSFLFSTVFWSGVLSLLFASGLHFWLTATLLFVILTLGAGKAWIRLNAVKLVLQNYEKELNKSYLWQMILWTITPAIYFYNSLCALFSNVIVWRGIKYKLISADKTEIIEGQ